MERNKVLITGASGFVGCNLIPYLEKRFAVTEMSRDALKAVNVEALEDCNVIIHLAGKAHDLKKAGNPAEYYQVNFELTKKIYDSFLKSKAQKFIFISSVKASADSVNGILDEFMRPDPKTDYGRSKLMAEEYIQSNLLPPGKAFFILRPCMIHGPLNKGNLNLLYQFVKRGIPYPLAAFNNERSYLSIDNLCFIISELISNDCIKSGIYNVSDDEALSTNEVVAILASSLNVKPKLWNISTSVIRFLAKVGDRLKLPLNSERLHKLTESYLVSNEKIKLAINKELPQKAIDGLKVTAKSFENL
jgi:nucleoside-diphosphate-sugar epimerase